MDYAQARSRMKSGDMMAFSYRASMFSSWYAFKVGMVRMFTKSEYSHVALIWVPKVGGRVFLIEAVMPRVRIYPLSNALAEGEDCFWIPLDVKWTPRVEEFAMSHIGQEYSQLKAVAASMGNVSHGRFTECAEMAIDVLQKAGVRLGPVATPTAAVRQALVQGATQTLITKD